MSKLNHRGPDNLDHANGRGLGLCNPEAECHKLGTGQGKRRRSGGGTGQGKRLKATNGFNAKT